MTNFKLKDFDGPLDLLLFLIRKNEVNIYDIPIAEITEQYIGVIRSAENLDLDETSDFHLLASNLLLIKSRGLLPVELESEDEEDPRQELVERLIEYQKFKKLSELMENKALETEFVIERRNAQRILPFETSELWTKMDVWDLCKTFSRIIADITPERVIDLYEETSINEKLALITELLEIKTAFSFNELVTRPNSLLDIVCAFLAVLEAMKEHMIQIYQNGLFGEIVVRIPD